MSFLAAFQDYVDAQVHASARHDARVMALHRSFIGSRILAGLIALACFPLYLVLDGVPNALAVLFFGWMLLPFANAYYLAHTGRYEAAHVIDALTLTALVTVSAAATGAAASPAAIWLVVVPLEAALSASRRTIAVCASFALTGLCVLLAMQTTGWAAAPAGGIATLYHALSLIAAVAYATVTALRLEWFVRTTAKLLSKEESRYHLLATNMTDVIARHGRNGSVLFVSPGAQSMLGTPPVELLGHGLFDRIHVGDRPAFLTAIADSAVNGASHSVEFRAKRQAEDANAPSPFIWIEMRCQPLAETKGEAGCEVVTVLRDVTQRKAQQQAMEDARSEADRANAAKGHFLATMSHELRTPLNSIIGFSEMLMHEDTLNIDVVQRHDYAQLINESGHHLLSVVNEVLDMSKIETGNFEITPEPFALGPVVANCCDLLALKARDAGIDLVTRIAALPDMTADKRALKQIVLNLISNAIKFTDRNGRVTIGAAVEGQTILLSVADSGIGIGEADLRRVGDPFFQARTSYARPYDGTGLGLSIVKGLAALHGGAVDIRSRLGEGTCVTVRLPIDCEAIAQANQFTIRPVSGANSQSVKQPSEQQVRKSA